MGPDQTTPVDVVAENGDWYADIYKKMQWNWETQKREPGKEEG